MSEPLKDGGPADAAKPINKTNPAQNEGEATSAVASKTETTPESKPVPEEETTENAPKTTPEEKPIGDKPKTDVVDNDPSEQIENKPEVIVKPKPENEETTIDEKKPPEKEIKTEENSINKKNAVQDKTEEIKEAEETTDNALPVVEKTVQPPLPEKEIDAKEEENKVEKSGDKVPPVKTEIQTQEKNSDRSEKGIENDEKQKIQPKVPVTKTQLDADEKIDKPKQEIESVNNENPEEPSTGAKVMNSQVEAKEAKAAEPKIPDEIQKSETKLGEPKVNGETNIAATPPLTQPEDDSAVGEQSLLTEEKKQTKSEVVANEEKKEIDSNLKENPVAKEKPAVQDPLAKPAISKPQNSKGELKAGLDGKAGVGEDKPSQDIRKADEKEETQSDVKKERANEEKEITKETDKPTKPPETKITERQHDVFHKKAPVEAPVDSDSLLPTQVQPVNEVSEMSPYSQQPTSVPPRSLPTQLISPSSENPPHSATSERQLDETSRTVPYSGSPHQAAIAKKRDDAEPKPLTKPVVPQLKLKKMKEKHESPKKSVSLSAELSSKTPSPVKSRKDLKIIKPMSPGPVLAIQKSPAMTCTSARRSLRRSSVLYSVDISGDNVKDTLQISPTVAQHRATPDFPSIMLDSSVPHISYSPILTLEEKEALEKKHRSEAATKIQSYYRGQEGRKLAKDELKNKAIAEAKTAKESSKTTAKKCETREMSSQTFLLSEHIKLRPGAKSILIAQLDLETAEIESTDTKFMMSSPKSKRRDMEMTDRKLEKRLQDKSREKMDSTPKRVIRKIEKIIGEHSAKLKILFNQYKSGKSETINLSSFIQMLKQKKVLRKLSQLPLVTKAFHTARGVHCADADLRLDFDDFCQALIKSGTLIYDKKNHKYPDAPSKVYALLRRLLRLIHVPDEQKSTPYIPVKSERYRKRNPGNSRSRSQPREPVDYHFSINELDDEIGRLFADEKLVKKQQRKERQERQSKKQSDASVASGKTSRKTQAASNRTDTTKTRRRFRRYGQNESRNPNANDSKRTDERKEAYNKTPSKPNPSSRRTGEETVSRGARKPNYKRRSRIKQKSSKSPKAMQSADVCNSAEDRRAFQKERRQNFNQQREEVSALMREKRELEALQQSNETKARPPGIERQMSQPYHNQHAYLPEDKSRPVMSEAQMQQYYQSQRNPYLPEDKPSPTEETQAYRGQPQHYYQSQEIPAMLMPEPTWAPQPTHGYPKQEQGGPIEMADKFSHYYPQEIYGQIPEPPYQQYAQQIQQMYSNMSPEYGQQPMQGHTQPPQGYQPRAAPIQQQQFGPSYHYGPQSYPQYGSGGGHEQGRIRQSLEANLLQKRAQQVQNEELVQNKEREQQYLNQFDTRQRTVLERVSPKPTNRHYKDKEENADPRHR